MKNPKAILAGKKAQAFGAIFEGMVLTNAIADGWVIKKIHNGVAGFGRTQRRVAQPFDFFAVKNGNAVFFDAKSCDSNSFSYNKIDQRQADHLDSIYNQGFLAGYLVFFRKVDKISFFSSSQLLIAKPKHSLRPAEGLIIGNHIKHSLDKLYLTPLELTQTI